MKNLFSIILIYLFAFGGTHLMAQECGCPADAVNLVNNPHFDNGTTGFNSNLPYSSTCTNTSYSIESISSGKCGFDNWLPGFYDHTQMTSAGRYMIIDGPEEATTANRVWRQRVNVVAGTEYVFSFWLRPSVTSDLTDDIRLGMFVNDIDISGTINPSESNDWEKHCAIWTATTTALVSINIRQVENFGAEFFDYGIDDIFFGTCESPVNPCGVTANFEYELDEEACQFQFINLSIATDNNIIAGQSWSFGDGSQSSEPNPTHYYTEPGEYEVCLTVYNDTKEGCCTDTYCEIIKSGCTPRDCTLEIERIANEWTSFSFPDCEWQFYAIYTSANPNVGFLWEFGDFFTSTEQNPVVDLTGLDKNFVICLTIFSQTADGCCFDQLCQGTFGADCTDPSPSDAPVPTTNDSPFHILHNQLEKQIEIGFSSKNTFTDYQLSIVDQQGQYVNMNKGSYDEGRAKLKLDTKDFLPGIYTARLKIDDEIRIKRFLIE